MGDAEVQRTVSERIQEELDRLPLPPALPFDCRTTEKSGVSMSDRLDVALIRTDRALGRANDRILRCAEWFDLSFPKTKEPESGP